MKKHGGRILLPGQDIIFQEHQVAVILDGVDHMALSKEEDGKTAPTSADSESDDEEEEEVKKPPKKEEKKAPELPSTYSCEVCTFINPMSLAACEMCGSPKPPDHVLLQQILDAQKAEAGEPSNAAGTVEIPKEEQKSAVQLKLDELAKDLSKIVSRLERKAYAEKKDKEEAAKKAAAEELAKKEAEERKAKEANEVIGLASLEIVASAEQQKPP